MVAVDDIPSIDLDPPTRRGRLVPPDPPVDAVLDTDTYNEIDDQFAVVYTALSPAIDVAAMYAAPFHNVNSEGPADGMEKSYDELVRVLDLIDHPDPEAFSYRGASTYLDDQSAPESSPAVSDLIERARARDPTDPLYVIAIGAPTNVATALHVAPEIGDRIVVVWLGGQPHDWHTASEFNLRQDFVASRTLFDSGVPLVQIPCTNVAQHVRSSVPELESLLADGGAIGEYLLDIFANYHGRPDDDRPWTKVIWDLAAVAYLVDPSRVPSAVVSSPILTREFTYSADADRHAVRVARAADRDAILGDFVGLLTDHA